MLKFEEDTRGSFIVTDSDGVGIGVVGSDEDGVYFYGDEPLLSLVLSLDEINQLRDLMEGLKNEN